MSANQQENGSGSSSAALESPVAPSNEQNNSVLKEVEELESSGLVREVGNNAVWSLSSCKPGFGVRQLRDGLTSTYWQSNGPQPHVINIQFCQKTELYCIMLYTDFKEDESYTPREVTIKIGNNFHDLQTVEKMALENPVGWIAALLKDKNDRPVKTFMVQISIEVNHQNGRDTHVRQVKVYSPCKDTNLERVPTYTSVEMSMLAVCR